MREKIANINSWLMAGCFACIPISIAPINILTFLMLILWVYEGRFSEKWTLIRETSVVWFFLAYVALHFISLLWSENLSWGIHMANMVILFAMFPLYLTVAKKAHLPIYIGFFLASMSFSELLSYGSWFGWWNINPNGDFTPFINHITYAPILAFAIYLVAYRLLFSTDKTLVKVLLSVFFVTMSVNLLFTEGRTGQVGLFVLVTVLMLQYFSASRLKALFVSSVLILSLIFVGYKTIPSFENRANLAIHEVQGFSLEQADGSVDSRMAMWVVAFHVFKDSPIVGVGIGDYHQEYIDMKQELAPQLEDRWYHPHSQYMHILANFGVVGMVLLALLFVFLVKQSLSLTQTSSHHLLALCCLFMVIGLADVQLLRANTAALFILFAALYSGQKRNANLASK